MKVLTDTAIPLLGNNSAISAYGPQKGLNRKEITQTQEQLQRIYELLATALNITLDPYAKNTGAAGGLSFVFEKILGCNIISGAEFFLKETSLIHKIPRSPITVVCEGKFDKTSLSGKVVGEILRHVSGDRYFLGGQYDYIDSNKFNGIYECGPKGLLNPKEELKNVAGKLLEQISI
jgi:glycerate kinase